MKNTFYIAYFFVLFFLLCSLSFGAEESVVALPGHELGDQMFSIRAGILLPLFWQDLGGNEILPANSSIGAAGALQWNFYLTGSLRLGIDIGLAFGVDINSNLYNMIPISFRTTYIFSISRFEFPVSLCVGMNILNHLENYDIGLIIRPEAGMFYRYDANFSFGLNIGYWWTLEFPVKDDPATAGNFLDITPALLYHF